MFSKLLSTAVISNDDLISYIPVIVILVLGGLIAAGLVGFVSFIGRRPGSFVKGRPFEAGSVPFHNAWRRIHVRYYIVALLFLVFDLETVFLLIWAPVLQELGIYGLVVMSLFIILLIVGLAYEWMKGALNWADDEPLGSRVQK